MRSLLAVAVLAAIVMNGNAYASPQASPAPPTTAAPSPRALALTRRVVVALRIQETMAPMMSQILQAQIGQVVAQNAKLTDPQKAQLTGVMNESIDEVISEGLLSDMMEKFVPIYAEVYTEPELQAMAEFYESPVGQSILKKMPLMAPLASKIAVEEMPRIQAALTKKLTTKLEGLQNFGK